MGRGTRDQKSLPLEKPVARKLSPDEHDRVAHQLAVKGLAIRNLESDLRLKTSSTRKDIKALKKEQAYLEDQLISHEQLVLQRDLKLSPDESKAALAKVGKVADERTVPHDFAPDGKGEGKCHGCGKPKDDVLHRRATPAKGPKAVEARS